MNLFSSFLITLPEIQRELNMPTLLRTPEEIFRTEKKDFHFIRFKQRRFEEAQADLISWLDLHIPDTRYEKIGPSENSGYISGYLGDLRIIFAESGFVESDFEGSDLQIFCKHWETPEGKSLDPRFQCYVNSYQNWVNILSQYTPQRLKPVDKGISIWWDTPIGIIYHQIGHEVAREKNLVVHPSNAKDLWFLAIQSWPELALFNIDELIYGQIYVDEKDRINVIYQNDSWIVDAEFTSGRQKAVSDWFNLSGDTIFHRA